MIVFLNGQFVPEERAVVSVHDRGFLYGDGLFETLLVSNGRPFRWEEHVERLERGAEFLQIRPPFSMVALRDVATQLIERNQTPEAVLRIQLSRGVGVRGYSPRGADNATLVMTLQTARIEEWRNPAPWRLVTVTARVFAGDPLSRFKTSNKLTQILARSEAETAGADEALLLNSAGQVMGTSNGNLFWIANGAVFTPPTGSGILPGVTRGIVFELCQRSGIVVREQELTPECVRGQDAVFISLSTKGIVEISAIDGQELHRSDLVRRIRESYWRLVQAEVA